MFNKDFYPTPPEVASKMLDGLKLHGAKVLEPSAGKGDLAKEIVKRVHGYRYKNPVFVIEKEPALQAILRENEDLSLVDQDFLEFYSQDRYEFIIMNPPFSNGLDHLIHALEVGDGAEVVCLMNSDTINGDSHKAKLIRGLVRERQGSIEELGACFSDAERKTKVEVALIKVKSKGQEFDFSFEAQFDQEEEFDFSSENSAELAIRGNVFEDYEKRYNLSCRAYAEHLKSGNKFVHYANSISSIPTHDGRRGVDCEISHGHREAFDEFRSKFRVRCWKHVLEKTKISGILPSKVKKKFIEQMEKQHAMNFTAKNMRAVFMDLYMNKDSILQQCVEYSFDLMTMYHKENRVHIEGWKSNDRWQVSRKIILPSMRDFYTLSHENHVDFNYSSYEKLHDILIGICWLAGKNIDKIKSIPRNDKSLPLGEWHDSEFFEFKMFKKGTLHLKFKSEDLWKKFNITACKGKNWLKGE